MSASVSLTLASTTMTTGDEQQNMALGLFAAIISLFFFGTNYLPVRQYKTGDGLFFQWMLAIGIWLVGLVCNCVHPYSSEAPQFFTLAMLGGVVWCTGNLMVVPVIQMIGMAGGVIVWGSTNMLMGWACGAFGLLGITSQANQIASWPLNIGGVVVALMTLVCCLLLRPEPFEPEDDDEGVIGKLFTEEEQALINNRKSGAVGGFIVPSGRKYTAQAGESWIDTMEPTTKQLVGCSMAALAGLLYGTAFNPPTHIMDNLKDYPGASSHGLDYVFAHFTGILTASTVYFAIYCVYTGNRPAMYPKVALPGLIAGIMWGIADAAWFVANENLAMIVAFPIITVGPGVVSALWGVFLLKELKGWYNYGLLILIVILTIVSGVMVAMSHK